MQEIINSRTRLITTIVATVYLLTVVIVAPAAVIAEEASGGETASTETTSEESTSTTETTPGIQAPTGPERITYTYNPETGLWENDLFTWDPVTKQTKPKFDTSYSYNPETGLWDTVEYAYVPETGTYEQNTHSTSTAPDGAHIANTGPGSENTLENSNGSITNTGPNSENSIVDADGTINNTGPESENNILEVNDNSGQYDLWFNADITNNVDSNATTGNASVLHNTTGGSATTGDAFVDATILNMIQSGWGFGGNTPTLYNSTIQGDYFGDIMIDPDAFVGGNATSVPGYDDLVVNATTDASIENNVNLDASTGNATVSTNTTGGDATSGDADAVANIVNMITSSIAAGESFLGVLNIDGNFEGDVLIPDDVVDQLLASNYPTSTVACACGDGDSSLTINNDNDQNINNNIVTNANSGTATVEGNNSAGNATSGDAMTNVTVLNLTGSNVVAENALLVFVNVLGEWVGMIVDAPGATSAAFAGGGDPSGYNALATGGDAEYNIDNDFQIDNNLNINANTGDAEVSWNTTGGDATSGDATASANVANITNSNFALGGWFGILFINVMGDWHGSFGEDTAYGDPTNLPPVLPGPVGNRGGSSTSNDAGINAAIAFEVTGNADGSFSLVSAVNSASESANDQSETMGTTAFEAAVENAADEILDSEGGGVQVGWIILAGAIAVAIITRDRWIVYLRPPAAS